MVMVSMVQAEEMTLNSQVTRLTFIRTLLCDGQCHPVENVRIGRTGFMMFYHVILVKNTWKRLIAFLRTQRILC